MKTKTNGIPQKTLVLKHLMKNKTLTPLECLKRYGIYRVASYVCQLRQEGFNIVNIQKEKKTTYAVYTLKK